MNELTPMIYAKTRKIESFIETIPIEFAKDDFDDYTNKPDSELPRKYRKLSQFSKMNLRKQPSIRQSKEGIAMEEINSNSTS